jgi:hypothetical protein
MAPQSPRTNTTSSQKPATPLVLLIFKEAAKFLKVGLSWLAEVCMHGDGPPYIRIGQCIWQAESALIQWMRGRPRMSTTEQ